MTWQIPTAQKKLNELVELANAEGPQVLARRRKRVAVVLGYADFEGNQRTVGSLRDFYDRCPFKGERLIIRQRRDKVRRVRL